jgi:hypothetical protein
MPVWHNQRTLCNCFMATPGSLAVTEDCLRRPAPPRPPVLVSAPPSARFPQHPGSLSTAFRPAFHSTPARRLPEHPGPRLPDQSGHRSPSPAPVSLPAPAPVPGRFRPLTCVIGPQAPTVKLLRQDRQQFSLQNLHQSRPYSGTALAGLSAHLARSGIPAVRRSQRQHRAHQQLRQRPDRCGRPRGALWGWSRVARGRLRVAGRALSPFSWPFHHFPCRIPGQKP